MVLFALSCFGLLLFLWLSFGGPVPLKPKGYEFKVAFPEAAQLGVEADVRVAGVNVGKVRAKTLDPRHRNRTVATIEVDAGYAPIAKDARAILRQKTLLGETFVELTPGPSRAAGDDPGRRDARRLARSKGTVAARRDLRRARPADTAPRSRAGSRRRSTGDPRPQPGPQRRARHAARVRRRRHRPAARPRRPEAADAALIRNTGVVFGALTQDERKLHDLIVTAGQTFDATARRQRGAGRHVPDLPDVPRRVEAHVRAARDVLEGDRPARPGPAARRCATRSRRCATCTRSRRTCAGRSRTSTRSSRRRRPACPRRRRRSTASGRCSPSCSRSSRSSTRCCSSSSTTSSTPRTSSPTAPRRSADTVPTATPNEVGHYLRQFGPIGPETVGDVRRTARRRAAATRTSTPARCRARSARRAMIFPNFDCDNAGGAAP